MTDGYMCFFMCYEMRSLYMSFRTGGRFSSHGDSIQVKNGHGIHENVNLPFSRGDLLGYLHSIGANI